MVLEGFLQSTSIHGVKYLYEAKNVIVRGLWLVCIASCFTAAVVIIRCNIVNWQNSPAVITQAKPTLIKDMKLTAPMVTVCPKRPDLRNLIVNYYNKHFEEKEHEELLGQLKSALSLRIRKRVHLLETEQLKTLDSTTADIISDCTNESEPCKFIKILKDVVTNESDCKPLDMLWDYLFVVSIPSQTQPTLDGLKSHFESLCQANLSNGDQLPKDEEETRQVLEGYAVFFDLFDGITSPDPKLNLLRGLNEFDLNGIPHPKDHIGTVLGHLVNEEWEGSGTDEVLIRKLEKSALTGVLEGASQMLGSPGGLDIWDSARVLNAFAYDANQDIIGDTEVTSALRRCYDQHGTDVCKITDDANATAISDECLKYCDITKGKATYGTVVKELYDMSLYNDDESPRSLLPWCSWKDGHSIDGACWRRVITEKGVCHTSYGKGTGEILRPTGRKASRYFIFDIPPTDMQLKRVLMEEMNMKYTFAHNQPFDVIVSPWGHFSLDGTVKESDVTKVLSSKPSLQNEWHKETMHGYMFLLPTNVVKTTKEFKAMAPRSRNCYFGHEKELAYFPEYSSSNCKLECAWDMARKTCGCVPWFLMDYFPSSRVCEVFGNMCFKGIVDSRYDAEDTEEDKEGSCYVGCLDDCETTEFRVTLGTEKLGLKRYYDEGYNWFCDTDELAMGITAEQKDAFCAHARNKANMSDAILGRLPKTGPRDLDRTLEPLVIVDFFCEEKTALLIMMTATMTVIDMISNIGGTLGLFSGFSILSGIEILYWLGKLVEEKLKNRKK